ncbi:MAG: hypothetical protein ACYS74_08985 [Planctomycetota bacterium]
MKYPSKRHIRPNLPPFRVFFDSPSDAARQHEEALKRAQLEADLIKAVAGGNGQMGSPSRPSQRYTRTTPKPRPT